MSPLEPRPISRKIDAAKAAIVALDDVDRQYVRTWILRWVRPDGSLAIPRETPSTYQYPERPK
jgi:hypothetical protein